ncbi:MAG: CDP-diacylglycerol--glycerol-3-phosphate 3-phosphatidyltransferase [Clostridia bacterium]|nr:CDP-diacylglycerol--glycerol-3-phosphate 3-phosphatidyltransferase [Clostridia bacterium]
MNTPNKLTLLRVILIPVYMIFYLCCGTIGIYLAIATFLLATWTDHLDGKLARKYHQVTTFGKLMDPLADKILIMAALISFVERGTPYVTSGVVMVILARELIVTGIRMLAMGENQVIAASMWGKSKTVSQFILVVVVMITELVKVYAPDLAAVCDGAILLLTVVATALTIYSGFDYVWKNRTLITFQ